MILYLMPANIGHIVLNTLYSTLYVVQCPIRCYSVTCIVVQILGPH